MSNINDVPMVMVLLSFEGMGLGIRTYIHTDSHVTTKTFELDALPNFLRYGALFTSLQCEGAPLRHDRRDVEEDWEQGKSRKQGVENMGRTSDWFTISQTNSTTLRN